MRHSRNRYLYVGHQVYKVPMGTDLDNILTQVDCPKCGGTIIIPYRQLRLYRVAGCSCGAPIRLEDQTPLVVAQGLTDGARSRTTEND